MSPDKQYTIRQDFLVAQKDTKPVGSERQSQMLTCWLFSRSSSSCVPFLLGYPSEADAKQSVKTSCKNKNISVILVCNEETTL